MGRKRHTPEQIITALRAGCSGSHARPSYRPATFSALTSTASYPRPPGRPLDS